MDDGLRLYVLADDELILWQRHFAATERLLARECFATACRAFPRRAVYLCDLHDGSIICQRLPALLPLSLSAN